MSLQEAKLDVNSAVEFILAGNATFTLRSLKTGARYTYKVRKSDDESKPPVWFVKLLTGNNNEEDFTYMGMIRAGKFGLTAKSSMTAQAPSVIAFDWFFSNLTKKITPGNIEIWHAGRCGRCGRTLTVPESVASGFGPECITKIAA